jgi:hypothetical protein
MDRFTGLARSIDLRYASNRIAIVATAAAALIGFAAGQDQLGTAISLGGATFLAWAIGREIDPDRPLTASVAAPLAMASAWVDIEGGHPPALGALYVTLVATRVIVRTTGRPPTALDLALHVGLVGWLSTHSLAWVAGLALAVVVVLDTKMEPPAPQRQLWWGALLGLVATLAAGILWEPPVWQAPSVGEWIPMVVGLTGALFLLRSEHPFSVGDHGHEPLRPRRVVAGRAVVVAVAIATALIGGATGVGALGAAWVALGVGGVVRILSQPV